MRWREIELLGIFVVVGMYAVPRVGAADGVGGAPLAVGEIWLGASTLYSFDIVNDSSAKITFAKASASSPCVRVSSFPKEVGPGARGRVEVVIKADTVGKVVYVVELEPAEPTKSSFRYALGVRIIGKDDQMRLAGIVPTISDRLIVRETRKIDPGLFLQPGEAVSQSQASNGLVIVDVRPKERFDKVRVVGALWMPVETVGSKPFLKSQPFALIDEGYRCGRLQAAVGELRKAGFRASIVAGGIAGWKLAGGKVVGDAFALAKLNVVSPSGFYEEKDYGDWVLLDTSPGGGGEQARILPGAVHVPVGNERDAFAAAVKTAIGEASGLRRILIVSSDGTGYEELDKRLSKVLTGPVFFLDGGLAAYNAFLLQQSAVLRGSQQLRSTGKPGGDCK